MTLGAVVGRVHDGRGQGGVEAGAVVVEALHRHHLGVGSNDARHTSPVTVDVGGIRVGSGRPVVAADEVPAMHVVDVSVLVVVEAVAGHLVRIGPELGRDIGVRVVDAGVDHRHHRAARTSEGSLGITETRAT